MLLCKQSSKPGSGCAGKLVDTSNLDTAVQPSWRRVKLQGSEVTVVTREVAALEWLCRVGAFPCERSSSFCVAVGRLGDGTHLARIVGQILGRPIVGILYRPCSDEVRRGNMQKCAGALHLCIHMFPTGSQKYDADATSTLQLHEHVCPNSHHETSDIILFSTLLEVLQCIYCVAELWRLFSHSGQ
jgi:hypothetical protein